jgi:segregation and condensation protein A
VTVGERLMLLRRLLSRGRFQFSDAVANADRVTVAVTLYALLELYKQGEASWIQDEPFAEITVTAAEPAAERPQLSVVPQRGAA